jgi:hypothetical protein
MAAKSGKQGLVNYKGVPVFRINNWEANPVTDMRNHTSFTTGSLQWTVTAPGLSSWTGTISGFWDPDGSTAQDDMIEAALAASTASFLFVGDKDIGGNLSGNGYVSGLTAGAAVDGDVTVSFDVTGNGALSYTTTT